MRASAYMVTSFLLALVSFRSIAAESVQDKVDLTVVRSADHVQFECNPVSIDTAMRSDWKAICNDLAAVQVQKLVAAGTIAPVSGKVFDASPANATGATLSKIIALSKPRH